MEKNLKVIGRYTGILKNGCFSGGKYFMKQKGLLVVFTGDGKGKTTAAVGSALRMIKHGKRVAMVQFFKPSGRHVLPHDKFKVWSCGGGFTWDTSREANQAAVDKAWKKCRALLREPKYSMIIFDEIHVALKYKFLKTADLIRNLEERVPGQHVILTGRDAPQALIRCADLVTEMNCLKHPFSRGIPAQPGLDF